MKASRFARCMVLTLFLLTFTLLLPMKTYAHNEWGGSWQTYNVIRWYYFGDELYVDNVADAEDNWNNAQSEKQLLHTVNSSLRRISIRDTYRGETWWGMTFHDPESFCNNCDYTDSDVYFNRWYIEDTEINYNVITKVTGHEFGHVFGMGHVVDPDPPASPEPPAIMKQGILNYYVPKPHDISDFNTIY